MNLRRSFWAIVFALAGAMFAEGAALETIWTFTGGADGMEPAGELIQARDGALYGTSRSGLSTHKGGAIFRITTNGVFTPLWAFTGGADGKNPQAGLVEADDGAFYGTTAAGGSYNQGTVFRFTTNGVMTPLWSFTGGNDGARPYAPLIQATDGALYGTTYQGGIVNNGTVFRITKGGVLTTLYLFTGGTDGGMPAGHLIQATDGALYGTCSVGGTISYGTIFRISTSGSLTTLWRFTFGADGANPKDGLLQGRDGAFYGTTYGAGSNTWGGTVYKFTSGGFMTPLWGFTPEKDGSQCAAGLIQASDGLLYGTQLYGGTNIYYGTVFKMPATGPLSLVWTFTGKADGAYPVAGLMQATDGKIYGSTVSGGTNASATGTLFRLNLGLPPAVRVSVQPNQSSAGIAGGGGVYSPGSFVKLFAIASNGWYFTGWNDGNTQNPRVLVAPSSNIAFTANFVPLVPLVVQGSPARGGFLTGAGQYPTTITQAVISATAHRGWAFTSWQDADTNAVRTVTIPTNGATFTASFVVTGRIASVQNDFERDYRSDIAVFWPAGGAWSVLKSSGGTLAYQLGYSATLAAASDYDGDGKADFALFDPPTGSWFINQSSNGAFIASNWGHYRTLPVPADYDGDGKADIAVYDPPPGIWYILKSTGGSTQQQWGWSQAIPVPADYDGDGKADIATYVPAAGQWSIRRSSDAQLWQIVWGWSKAIPVPADYDGDEKADIAIYVPETGQWAIRRSSDGGLTQSNWGWLQSAPVPADYDGDGKADLAVYHPATGNWYILKSSGGSAQQQWGWSQALPVAAQFQVNRRYFPAP